MNFLTAYLNQTATWWKTTGKDGFGDPTFAAPVTLKVRWEGNRKMIISPEGVAIPSRAKVFLDRDIDTGDYLALGASAVADPRNVITAFEVLEFRKIPSLDGLSFERRATL